jgi:hypothetical protein
MHKSILALLAGAAIALPAAAQIGAPGATDWEDAPARREEPVLARGAEGAR